MFQLDERLKGDGPLLENLFPDHLVIVKKNALYPWLVVVPMIPHAREIFDLEAEARNRLFQVVAQVSKALSQITGAHKINVASLGNIVSQLHVHITARSTSDPSWPDSVWHHPIPEGDVFGTAFSQFAANLRDALQRDQ